MVVGGGGGSVLVVAAVRTALRGVVAFGGVSVAGPLQVLRFRVPLVVVLVLIGSWWRGLCKIAIAGPPPRGESYVWGVICVGSGVCHCHVVRGLEVRVGRDAHGGGAGHAIMQGLLAQVERGHWDRSQNCHTPPHAHVRLGLGRANPWITRVKLQPTIMGSES